MGTAIDEIVAAACRRLLPRCRCMCAACFRAGGSRRRSCITGRSRLAPRASTAVRGSSTDNCSDDRCSATTLAAVLLSEPTGTSIRR